MGEVFGHDTQSERAGFVKEHGSTWAFDATAVRSHLAMACGEASDRVIPFGDSTSALTNETWIFDPATDTPEQVT